eukprot:COSAG01_NODE_1728_length_9373_cov_25.243476_4_plen_90_part_00
MHARRDAPMEQEMLGLYVIRGDNMCDSSQPDQLVHCFQSLCEGCGLILLYTCARACALYRAVIGAVDQVMDQQLDLDAVRAEPIKSVVH